MIYIYINLINDYQNFIGVMIDIRFLIILSNYIINSNILKNYRDTIEQIKFFLMILNDIAILKLG